MSIDDTYIIPEPVLRFLLEEERSFLALRLVHGILYALHNSVHGKMTLVPAQFHSEHSIRTSTLADAVGPEESKDNRWVHKACRELAEQNIFQKINITGRRLRFQLSKKFIASFSTPSKVFAIMHTDQIRECRTMHDLMFLSLACLHGGKNRPKFYLPRIPHHLEAPKTRLAVLPQEPLKQAIWRAPWSVSSRSWVNAAIRVSQMLNHGYLIGPQQDMVDDFISLVPVKIQHHKTQWERGRLYKFPAGTRSVIEICARGKKTVLKMEELKHKWHQTTIH